MKIAYIYQADGRLFEQPYAAQIHIINIIRSLKKRGHEIKLMTLYRNRQVVWSDDLDAILSGQLQPDSDLAPLPVTGHPLFKTGESAIRRTQAVLRFPYLGVFDSSRIYEACARYLSDVDVIHERYKMQAIGAGMAGKGLRAPLVLEVNGDSMDEWELRGRPVRGLRRRYATWATDFTYRRANQIICVSNDLRTHLVKRWKLNEERITVLPNGADIEKFGQTSAPGDALTGFDLRGYPLIIVVGGFFEWHDLGLLLESFKLARKSRPDASLVLVGDGDTRTAVTEMAEALGLQDSVRFTGHVPHDLIPQLLAVAHIAIVPIKASTHGYGASPLKLYEYMAAGKAIIASRTGQNSEVIQHGRTGLLYEPGDPISLCEALTTLMDNPERRQQLGANARQDAVQKHSWDSYAERLERIYEKAIQQTS